MGILLLSLYFSVKCFVDHCLSLCPSVLSGDRVTQSLLLCEVFCRSLFVPLSFVLIGDLVDQSLRLCEMFCRSLFVPLSFVLSGDLVDQSLLCVKCFVDHCLSICPSVLICVKCL